MRKAWTAALLAALLAGCLPGGAALGEQVTVDGVVYELGGGSAVVVGYDPYAETITFHPDINGLPVRGDWMGLEKPMAKTVILAEGINTVENGQCFSWQELERAVLPSSLREIGESAFGYCGKLTEVNLPEGLASLGSGAFAGCEALESVALPASLVAIGPGAFSTCAALTAFTVPGENPALQAIDGAVYSKDGATLLAFPEGRGGAFALAPGTVRIAPQMFGYACPLTSLTIPEGMTRLESGVLSALYMMETLYLPASLETIEEYALPTYGALRRVEVDPANPWYESVDGVLYRDGKIVLYPYSHGASFDLPAGMLSVPSSMFQGNRRLETLTLPPGMTAIEDYAFEECVSLSRIQLPLTLTAIGAYAFSDCIALASLTLPPSLATIGDGAFTNCASLTSLRIPEGVTSIGSYAFCLCESLKAIHIPDSVTSIGENAFQQCGPDLVIYSSRNSPAYWHAYASEVLWAEPGGIPARVTSLSQRQTQAAVVNNDKADQTLNLRSEPSESGKVLGKYENGTTVEVLGTEGEWSHVRLNGQEGYMYAQYLALTDRLTGATPVLWAKNRGDLSNPLPVTLYDGPSRQAASQRLDLGFEEFFLVLDTLGVWYRVQCADGRTGYVLPQEVFVSRSAPYDDERGYAVITSPNERDRLNLRQEPSRQSASLGMYFNGTVVEILSWEGEWARVSVDGKTGYMMTEFLSAVRDRKDQLYLGNG